MGAWRPVQHCRGENNSCPAAQLDAPSINRLSMPPRDLVRRLLTFDNCGAVTDSGSPLLCACLLPQIQRRGDMQRLI